MSRRHPPVPVVQAILPVTAIDDVAGLHAAVGGEVQRFDEHYAFVLRHGHELWHLQVVDDLDPASNHGAVYVHVEDPDEVHARLEADGFAPAELRDEPWGMREFTVTDASGNRLRIGRNS